jgi:2-amino-4-hydroxy-6-hydroxymethyldihydropteridine diphosphokinase
MAATKAYLGLGTNLGNRTENLKRAVSALETTEGVRALRLSCVYETAAWGTVEQTDFLNMAEAITTDMRRAVLVERPKQIEQELGGEESE